MRKLVPELSQVYVHEINLAPGRPPCDFEDADDIDRVISELVEDAYELVFARRRARSLRGTVRRRCSPRPRGGTRRRAGGPTRMLEDRDEDRT